MERGKESSQDVSSVHPDLLLDIFQRMSRERLKARQAARLSITMCWLFPLPSRSEKRRSQRGFSLLETLVALSLLGVAMLMTLSLMFQEPRVVRRLTAHEQVLRALEETLEGIRAGRIVQVGQHRVDPEAWSSPAAPVAQDLSMWTVREEESASGLYRLSLMARYRVDGRWFDRTIETKGWSPP